MKKVILSITSFIMIFILTGCVKYEANMDIKKDKSMNFNIIYAYDTSLFNEQEILSDEDKEKLNYLGYSISEYQSDKFKGYNISKKIDNIDSFSKDEATNYSISNIIDNDLTNGYIFTIKKGFLKNKYAANFTFNAVDSEISDRISEAMFEKNYDSTNYNPNEMDYTELIDTVDLTFNVNLPYRAISHNAIESTNNNKNLTWNLSAHNEETVEFEFELYNMNNIYFMSAITLLAIILVVMILKKIKKI